jgi:hypothetical protein
MLPQTPPAPSQPPLAPPGCDGGKERTSDAHCCWPGQTWQNGCSGAPSSCPPWRKLENATCTCLDGSTDEPCRPGPPRRDPRAARLAPRARALLITELQGLESLFASVPKTSPDRPSLIRRLAEDYAELARSAHDDAKVAATAHRKSSANYALLAADYPDYAHIDEVNYYRGFEDEQTGDLAHARAAYFAVIQKTPNSKLVPYAYFAFAELFAAEASSDASKWPLAQQSYAKVLDYQKTPLEQNAMFALSYVYEKMGDAERSKQMLVRLRQSYP